MTKAEVSILPRNSCAEQRVGTTFAVIPAVGRQPYVVLFIASLSFAAWLTFAGARIETLFLHNYGFFCDPSSYYVHNLHLYQWFQSHGTWPTVLHELEFNARHPLRTVPCLILAPKLLLSTTGHLWTQAPLLLLFLGLFSVTVYRRTHSLLFALGATSLFAGFPFLYDPSVGLGAYWLDFTAACALGSAVLCLIGYVETRHISWMLGFGACFSATALSRYSSAFYLLAYSLLAVPIVLWMVYMRDKMRVLTGFGAALSTALPGVVFVTTNFELNRQYYETFGFAFGAPISQSIDWTFRAVQQMFGIPLLVVLGIFVTASIFTAKIREHLGIALLGLWLPISIFLFVCLVVKAINGTHPLVYFAPAFLIASFAGFAPKATSTWRYRAAGCVLMLCAVWSAAESYNSARRLANSAPPAARLAKSCDQSLADLIIKTHAATFLQINDETVNPHLEAFFKSGYVCSSLPIFSKYESYLKGMYPGQDVDQMKASIYQRVEEKCALIAVFSDPTDVYKLGVFQNDRSAAIAKYISTRVRGDHNFRRIGTVESPTGLLAVYENGRLLAH